MFLALKKKKLNILYFPPFILQFDFVFPCIFLCDVRIGAVLKLDLMMPLASGFQPVALDALSGSSVFDLVQD